jgi:hypothetical protein
LRVVGVVQEQGQQMVQVVLAALVDSVLVLGYLSRLELLTP